MPQRLHEAEAELAATPFLVAAPAPAAPYTNLSAISGAVAACVSELGLRPRVRRRARTRSRWAEMRLGARRRSLSRLMPLLTCVLSSPSWCMLSAEAPRT